MPCRWATGSWVFQGIWKRFVAARNSISQRWVSLLYQDVRIIARGGCVCVYGICNESVLSRPCSASLRGLNTTGYCDLVAAPFSFLNSEPKGAAPDHLLSPAVRALTRWSQSIPMCFKEHFHHVHATCQIATHKYVLTGCCESLLLPLPRCVHCGTNCLKSPLRGVVTETYDLRYSHRQSHTPPRLIHIL